jgi:hypothetical protein
MSRAALAGASGEDRATPLHRMSPGEAFRAWLEALSVRWRTA